MAGDDRSVEEHVKAAVEIEARIERLEDGFDALIQRGQTLGWYSFLRDLKAAGFDVGELP